MQWVGQHNVKLDPALYFETEFSCISSLGPDARFCLKERFYSLPLKGLKTPLISTIFPSMAADASNLCTWEAEAGELRELGSEHVDKLGYSEALSK